MIVLFVSVVFPMIS